MSELTIPRISHVGDSGLLFEAPGAFSIAVQTRIWNMAASATGWDYVAEAVPGVTNLLLVFNRPPPTTNPLRDALLTAWESSGDSSPPDGRLLDVPVTYGGANGADLAAVCERTGLSPEEVVRRHAANEYRVFAIGSQPGFAYLGGLDPTIAIPRKAIPVLRVPTGTVVIGGLQTGVVAASGPNGWNAIGHTTVRLFDPSQQPATLFEPADRIRLHPIGLTG